MIAVFAAALGLALFAPAAVPDSERLYGWVCPYLDAHPSFFGVMGLAGEVERRKLDASRAEKSITVEVRNNCPQHVPLLSTSLGLVF